MGKYDKFYVCLQCGKQDIHRSKRFFHPCAKNSNDSINIYVLQKQIKKEKKQENKPKQTIAVTTDDHYGKSKKYQCQLDIDKLDIQPVNKDSTIIQRGGVWVGLARLKDQYQLPTNMVINEEFDEDNYNPRPFCYNLIYK
ncbi:hypothetical protein OXYTRIMIC_729 [Oxytricha trifallax]|uniref:Uncharacterized protein n=1 Tax=Oxytricha trifallax TaxID=1172189 RepID=A0A073HYV8_9SPIT|nr:hypothetical protein OXYTRIMIC_729 [Oxytricha trifallax]